MAEAGQEEKEWATSGKGVSGVGGSVAEEVRAAVLRELEARQAEAIAASAKYAAYSRKQCSHLAEMAATCAFRASKVEAEAAALLQEAAKFRLHAATISRKLVQQSALAASTEAAAAAAVEHAKSLPVKEARQREAVAIADKLAKIQPTKHFRSLSGGRTAEAALAGHESGLDLDGRGEYIWTSLHKVAVLILESEVAEDAREREAAAMTDKLAQKTPTERLASEGCTAEASSTDESVYDADLSVTWADMSDLSVSPKAALRTPQSPLEAESTGAPSSASPTSATSRASPASPDSRSAPSALPITPTLPITPSAIATSPLGNNPYSALSTQSGSDERETMAGVDGDPEGEVAGTVGPETSGTSEPKKGRRRSGGRKGGR